MRVNDKRIITLYVAYQGKMSQIKKIKSQGCCTESAAKWELPV